MNLMLEFQGALIVQEDCTKQASQNYGNLWEEQR
jgi:hypothetical protein